MIQLQQRMIDLYYSSLELYANKHNVEICIPCQTVLTETDTDVVPVSVSIYSDEYIYRKQWNKLNVVHKILKVKEFINNINIDDIEIKKNIREKLVNMVKDKKLTKKNKVNYDSTNGVIKSIPCIQCVDNKYSIKD